MQKLKDYQILLLGIAIAFGFIFSAFIVSKTLSRTGIEVTGSANQIVNSDFASWRLEFTVSDPSTINAYNKINQQSKEIQDFLIEHKINENEIKIEQITSYPVYKTYSNGISTNQIDYYKFTRAFVVNSNDINKITSISQLSQSLFAKGIQINSYNPQYFYMKLDSLKVSLLEKATENAKVRATSMLKSTGNRVGSIKSSKMGVFQITPKNSTEVSDYGINDTSSVEKKITAVVQTVFRIK